jgi:hypothetical protein
MIQYNVGKILIRCPNWVGDIVMATPVLDCIRENFPHARITGIIGKNAQGIVRDGPWFDDFIDQRTRHWPNVAYDRKWALKPDTAICCQFGRSVCRYGWERRNIYTAIAEIWGCFLAEAKPLRSG